MEESVLVHVGEGTGDLEKHVSASIENYLTSASEKGRP